MYRLLAFIVLTSFCLIPSMALAQDNAIKTANYFMWAREGLNYNEHREALANYDLLVLPAEAQVLNKHFFEDIRSRNPDIILLAYVATTSYSYEWSDALHDKLLEGIQESWKLQDINGKPLSVWPNTFGIDITSGWNDYLVNFAVEDVYGSGYWDGIFYDEVNDVISHIGQADLQAAGNIDTAWESANIELFSKTRERLPEDALIVTNGSSNTNYAPYVNGRMYESFPTPGEGNWYTNVGNAFGLASAVTRQDVIIFNSDTNNTGDNTDYKKVRFGLTSALLADAFFGFDFGTTSHGQLWHFDEYDAFIGLPVEPPVEIDGIWHREFTAGKVITNPTSERTLVNLGGEFEKLHGTQDPDVNDGAIISRALLDPQDGLVLVRPIEEILDSVFTNGAFARVFSGTGQVFRTGFFTYDDDSFGGMEVIKTDIDNDGNIEKITADGNQVFIYNEDGTLHASFYPYTSAYSGGVNIAVGDLENDGWTEIVTGSAGATGGGHVRVFNADGILINPGFFPYDEVYRGGIKIGIGDLDGDGNIEIVTGAGVNGGPHVRIFSKHGHLINPGFFAYDPDFRGGVNIAVGDVNGDGVDDIVTGPGAGMHPEVRVYDKDGNFLIDPFIAFDDRAFAGVRVTTSDINGDGIEEIISLSNDVFTLSYAFGKKQN